MKFFSKTLSILISLFIGVKSQEFFGCYEYDVANMEFLTFASHLDPNLATPALCSKACDSMGLPFSAITSSMFCFCRLTAPTASVKVSDDTCYSLGMCTADTNQYCGHSKYMLVYTGDTTVEMTPNTNPSSLNLFDSLTYTYNGSTPAKNLIIKSNGLISGYQPLYGTATIFFTQTGITTLEATSSGGLMKDSNSQRIVISSPTVKDDLSNYTLDCPLSGLNDEIFRCDLRFNKGIGTVLNIDFNDATTQSANLPDTELYAFGIPVPQKISTTLLNKSTGSSVNLLYNTFFKTDGILRAVEIYAETAGTIYLNIYAHSTCSSQYSSLKSPQSSCGDLKTSSTFGCTSSFMKGLERCDTDDAGQKNFYNIPSTSFTQIKTEPITLTAGYNLIQPFGGATEVKQGWILGLVQNTGRVSIDASGKAPVSDYTDASPLLNSTCNGAFHIRAFVSKPTIFSASNLYTLVKNYTLSASITSPINIAAKTASFAIYERIQELSVITDNGQCQVDVECTFTATTLKGSGITYEWRLPSINTTTTTTILKHTFTSNGVFDIILFAYNPVSNETYLFTIKVLIVVSKPKLFASSLFSTDSSSIVGKNAEFLFTLKTGLGYTCTINWGDLSTEKFDDSLSPKNNTIFVHLYAREANYNVSIYCENSISNDFSSIIHSAQHEITNLRLTRWFSFRNIQFSVEFALDLGTSPEFQMTYNGQTDSVTYNSVSRTGAGSPRIGTSSGLNRVILIARNKVSNVTLDQNFEIGAKIRNPQFILTNTNSFRPGFYNFGTQLNFIIKMDDGANVRMRFFFGDQDDLKLPSLEVNTTGDWNSDYPLSYTHTEPGDFQMYVIVFNAFDSFILNQSVSIVTDVNNLIPGLAENPVVYSPVGSFAFFMFSYVANTKSGSHASVTFWPGDLFNVSFGPYLIGMNFKINSTVNRLMYKYQAEGEYTVHFLVENMLGSKHYSLTFKIKQGVYGLFINFQPIVRAGTTFNIETYLVQGENVTYEWSFDGEVKTALRQATSVARPDNVTFATSIEKNATLVVKASDPNSAQILKYIVQIQTPVVNASLRTLPSDTSGILNDGTAASRTITFIVEPLGNPTNPYVMLDFGDGKPPANPVYLGGQLQITYTYDTIGAYNVSVTIFNQISTMTFNRIIKIISNIVSFNCIPKFRLVPIDGTEETVYTPANGIFRIDREKNLRLHCTWLHGLIDRFVISINGISQTYTDFSNLNYAQTGTSFSIILPFLSDNLRQIRNSSVLQLSISYSNARFRSRLVLNTTLFSAIILRNAVDNTTVFPPGSSHTFIINYETLSEPSCASVTLSSTGYQSTPLAIGTDAATCSSLFPGLTYSGPYDASNSTWRVQATLSVEGNIRMTAVVRNSATSQTVSTVVTVTSLPCAPPLLALDNLAEYFYLPIKIARTKMITLLAETTLRCNLTLSNEKGWRLFSVSPSNGNVLREIDISKNPTSPNAELVVQPNNINYGLYKFVFTVRMIGSNLMGRIFESSIETYVKIVPTGIVVWALKGGVAEGRYGLEQELEFKPVLYSFDQDSLVSISSLKFKFYCTTVDSGIARSYPRRNVREKLDLFSLKNGTFPMTSNTTCFENPNGYSFDSTGNSMKIFTSFLTFYKIRVYRFMIATEYLEEEYYQEFDLLLDFVKKTPVISLGCNPPGECKPYPSFQKINPCSQLQILGTCEVGCEDVNSISYSFQIYRKLAKPTVDDAWIPFWMPQNIVNGTRSSNGIFLNSSHILGSNTNQMVMLSELFKLDETAIDYKIDLTVNIISEYGINTGSSSLKLRRNKLPEKGTCSVTPSEGLAMQTLFSITCTGWQDYDGKVVRYEYYATFNGVEQPISLGYDAIGKASYELPLGPAFDNYKMYLYVEIIDNDDGSTIYYLNDSIVVKENTELLAGLMDSVTNFDPSSETNTKLFSGKPQVVLQVVNSITSMLNNQGFGDKNGQSGKAIVGFGPYQGIPSNANFDNLDSVNISSNYAGAPETNPNDTSSFEENREKRSQVRDALFAQINSVSISDMSSLKLWSAVLTTATQASDELSRSTSETAANQCLNLAKALDSVSNSASLDNIKQVATGIIGTINNIASGLSSSLNGYSGSLKKDLKDAAVPDGDNDLENFWNNPNNLESDSSLASLDPVEKVNNFKKKFQLVDTVQKSQAIIDKTLKTLSSRLNLDQSLDINTPTISMNVKVITASNLPPVMYQGLSKIGVPSFCDILSTEPTNNTNSTKNPLYTPPKDPNSCENKAIIIRTKNEPIAPTGINGANETNIQDSNTVSLEFLDDKSDSIKVSESREPIDLWIPRNPTISAEFTQVNTTNLTLNSNMTFLPNGLTITSVNTSVFIQIEPYFYDIGYFVWYKLGLTPIFNDTSKGFCPEDLKKVRAETYYQMSINQSEINGFKGFIGLGIREMTQEEFNLYCDKNNTFEMVPLSRNISNFTSDFGLRVFSSACYYYDKSSGKWSSDGVEIMDDSNVHYTHCKSKHLTTFAGGFIVVPPAINFEKVFANASFADNPTIYTTLIVVSTLFIILMIIARYMDSKDAKKLGLNLLPDNNPYHDYCYELMVFTGSRKEAATDSKVRFILSGEDMDSGVRCLSDPRRKIFRRGGIDSFIMAVERPLGQLNYLRIWHDNSGEDDYASWYLKFVIIRDLQTKEKSYFLCEKWLAVEKDDGQIDRLLPIATEVQKTNLQYLAAKETKKKISDEHLWLSIMSRPVQSSFTRMDRVTCCFVLLYITMLMNILYYGVDKDANRSGLELGPLMITPTQIGIGIMTNLIIFPPTLLLVYLFRNSRRRTTQLAKLNKTLDKTNKNNEMKITQFDDLASRKTPTPHAEKTTKKKSKGLPWWCKIIAYILSAICMGVSVFFIAMQGINLGDEKVRKWLTSFLVSVVSSVFLTQPIKIVLTAFVVILICRKSNDVADTQHDGDEDDLTFENKRQLNKDQRFEKYREYTISVDAGKLSQDEINEARKNRESEVMFWKMVKEVTGFFIFMMILFVFSYSTRDPNAFHYKSQISAFLIGEEFDKIKTTNDMWTWIINDFAPKIRISKWYNDRTVSKMGGFFNDFTSRMIGYAVLRSNRVQNNSCTLTSNMANMTQFCVDTYSLFNEEKGKFGYNWTEFNESTKPDIGMERIYSAYQYRESNQLPIYNSFGQGGFIYEMRGKLDFIRGNMSMLQLMNWVDRQTRSVFIEFTVYNPNINLFCVASILFDIQPSGNIIKTPRFNVLKILTTKDDAIEIGTGVAYLAIIVYFMFREIVKIFKLKRLYFKQFWAYMQWTLIVFSWAALGMYLYRVMTGEKVKKFFAETKGYGYINLTDISYWNDMLSLTIALCTCLATLKFIKLLRFNSNIIVLITAIRNCFQELVGISFMMLIWFLAFAQLFYFIFCEKIMGFSTLIKAITTCFQILLGKFEVNPILRESSILGPLFFAAYNLMVLIIIISVFITVISDNFIEVKKNKEAYLIETDLTKYLIKKLRRVGKKVGFGKKEQDENGELAKIAMNNSYVAETDLLTNRLNRLLVKINDYKKEQLVYDNIMDQDSNQ